MTIQSIGTGALRGLYGAGGFLSRPRKARWLYLTAFLTPVVILGFMWAVCGVIPFGSKMILAHDQWHQYYPFFLDLRSRLLNGESLLHSWTTGMGTNYLSLFAYYLASPLNLPAVLLPESLLMSYYSLTVLVRVGLAGLFTAFFLKKTFGREELAVVFFSTAYAFCAFLMGYYWNAIWLDTVALLPLVTLGTFSLLRDRRYVLYVVSLALAVYCSYYIGLFICIWVLLLFIGWHVVNWDDFAGFWTRFWRIALFTLIALGMTALLTIPAYLGLQSTSSAVNKFPNAYALNIVNIPEMTHRAAMELINRGKISELFTFFGREAPNYEGDSVFYPSWMGLHETLLALRLGYPGAFLAGLRIPLEGLESVLSSTGTLTAPTTMEGGPNIFCGFLTFILALVYLGCKRVPLRERIFTVLLLLFFGCSFLFRTLDYLWHGMHFPNMLPHRFSFLWCFTVIFMAFRAYTQLEHLPRWRAIVLIVPVALLLVCIAGYGTQRVLLASTGVAIVALALLLLYSFRVIRKELLVLCLCVVMFLESLGCAILGVNKIGFTDSSYYPTKKFDTESVVETMLHLEEDPVDLWRAEVAMKQTLNDGTLLGYNGISVFSSAANARMSQFMQSIGIAGSVAGNRYVYQEADPFTNLILGLKYLIDRNGRNVNPAYFREVARQGEVILLENQRYLSLGFLVNDNALEYDSSQTGGLPFERLNHLFREMTDEEEALYEQIPMTGAEAVGTAELSAKTSTSFTVKGVCDEENYVEASFTVPEDGLVCLYSKGSSVQDVIYFLNGVRQYTWSDAYGYNRCMGSFSAGDRISIRYRAKSGKNGNVTLGAALFRTEVFERAYEQLAERSMIPTLVSDTRIEGAIRVREAGLLYLSIPADDGWSLTVDGEKTRITAVGDAMIAVHLEPGLHAIALEYEAPGFSLGLKISVISLAVFLAFLIVALLSRFSRPPIVKLPVTLADPRRDEETADPDAPPAAEPMPPRGSGNTMPRLDLTQPWDEGDAAAADTAPEAAPGRPPEASAAGETGIPGEPSAADAPPRPSTGRLPEAAAFGLGEKPPAADFLAELRVDEWLTPEGEEAAPAAAEGSNRRLLSTTGVFDPTAVVDPTAAPPEVPSGTGSFNALEHLERLERLLEEADKNAENQRNPEE